MPKQLARWGQILPGDIVSFRYNPLDETKKPRMQTILVLNPKFPKVLKSGEKKFYINGIKLEQSNIRLIKNLNQNWELLNKIGKVEIVDLKNEIYKVNIPKSYLSARGAKQRVLVRVMIGPFKELAQYRTYIWETAKVKGVFYEPIKLPKDKIKLMVEQQGLEDED